MTPLCAVWVNRQAIYTPNGLPVVWLYNKLPLRYVLQLDEGHAGYRQAIKDAAQGWNRTIGTQVLTEAGKSDEASLFITSGSSNDQGLAVTTHSGDIVPESAIIELRSVCSFGDAYGVATHELGHVLGLADGERGCMGPLPEEFDPSTMFWLPTDEELRYLKDIYTL